MRSTPHPYADLPFVALAHRGGALLPGNEGRENTLAAFQRAADLGYLCLETDVRVTADGLLVAFHDDDTERLTGQPGTVEARLADAVAELRVGGQPIPTVDQLFETFPEKRFNIDLKGPGTDQALAWAIARHRAQDRVLVASFDQARLSSFRALTRGEVATAAAQPGIAWSRYVPLLPSHLSSPGQAFQVPLRHRLGPRQVTVFHPRLVAHAHATGRQVHVWTVDDAAEMNRLIDAGADGLITDRPDILKAVLHDRGLWEGSHD
ncbi:MAG: glycerophosphodiester phosphodiesterase [Propionibacteriaceae bacterium]|nr:glycerophosphodiester phosphodiesterase [Propionibacteriaceae bacterium]